MTDLKINDELLLAHSNQAVKLSSETKPKINKEYEWLARFYSKQDYSNLMDSIKTHGFWKDNPILLNKEHEIIDGYHRYKICKELGIEPIFIIGSFDNKLLEKEYVIINTVARRQLNSYQKCVLALELKPIFQEMAKRNSTANLKQNKNKAISPSVRIQTVGNGNGRVDDKIARIAGRSRDTLRKVEYLQTKASIEQSNKLESDTDSIHSVYNDIIREDRRQEIMSRANNSSTSVLIQNKNLELINSDFRKIGPSKIADNSVKLIFTDPPYEKKYLTIYDDLAKYAARTLVPGRSLIMYLRQYDIPTIFRYMENAGLTYHWMIAVKLGGPFDRAHSKNIVIKQKLLGWFVKGIRRIDRPSVLESVDDLIESDTPSESKKLDKWAQSTKEASEIIRKLTLPNETVLDPMMGRYGTTGKAALKLKRKFIGVEINSDNFELAKANLTSEI